MSYLVLDPHAEPAAIFETPRQVVDSLKTGRGLQGLGAVDPKRVIWFDNADIRGGTPAGELGAARRLPTLVPSAVAGTKIRQVFREVPRMSEEEAFARVQPYLPRSKRTKVWRDEAGNVVKVAGRSEAKMKSLGYYSSPSAVPLAATASVSAFLAGLINQNYKTSKAYEGDLDSLRREMAEAARKAGEEAPDERDIAHKYRKMLDYQRAIRARRPDAEIALVKGLSLLPATMPHSGKANRFVEDIRPAFRQFYGIENADAAPVRANLCVGASAECRESCLVFSGHNTSDDYNVVRKYALTQALLREPEAFVRLMHAAIKRFFRSRVNQLRMVRLNVLSDIPWELVAPCLIEDFPEFQFYDYTKVHGRSTPANYDLTFSYSGRNDAEVEAEYDKGRRIAVVFGAIRAGDGKLVRPKPRELEGAKYTHRAGLRPWRVIDGESSDTRPLDPGQVVIGLPWKAPKVGEEVEVGAFVVKGTIKGDSFVVEQIPRGTTDVNALPDDEAAAEED